MWCGVEMESSLLKLYHDYKGEYGYSHTSPDYDSKCSSSGNDEEGRWNTRGNINYVRTPCKEESTEVDSDDGVTHSDEEENLNVVHVIEEDVDIDSDDYEIEYEYPGEPIDKEEDECSGKTIDANGDEIHVFTVDPEQELELDDDEPEKKDWYIPENIEVKNKNINVCPDPGGEHIMESIKSVHINNGIKTKSKSELSESSHCNDAVPNAHSETELIKQILPDQAEECGKEFKLDRSFDQAEELNVDDFLVKTNSKPKQDDMILQEEISLSPDIDELRKLFREATPIKSLRPYRKSFSLPHSPSHLPKEDDGRTSLCFEDLNISGLTDFQFEDNHGMFDIMELNGEIRPLNDDDVNSFLITEPKRCAQACNSTESNSPTVRINDFSTTVPKNITDVNSLTISSMILMDTEESVNVIIKTKSCNQIKLETQDELVDDLRQQDMEMECPVDSQITAAAEIDSFPIFKTSTPQSKYEVIHTVSPISTPKPQSDVDLRFCAEMSKIKAPAMKIKSDVKVDQDDFVDVESLNDSIEVPVLAANNVCSLLEQFEATENFNKGAVEAPKETVKTVPSGYRLQQAATQFQKTKMRHILMTSPNNYAAAQDHDYCSPSKRPSMAVPPPRCRQSLLKPEVVSNNHAIKNSRHRSCKSKKIIYAMSSDDEDSKKDVNNCNKMPDKNSIVSNHRKKEDFGTQKPRPDLAPVISSDAKLSVHKNSGSIRLTIKNKTKVILKLDEDENKTKVEQNKSDDKSKTLVSTKRSSSENSLLKSYNKIENNALSIGAKIVTIDLNKRFKHIDKKGPITENPVKQDLSVVKIESTDMFDLNEHFKHIVKKVPPTESALNKDPLVMKNESTDLKKASATGKKELVIVKKEPTIVKKESTILKKEPTIVKKEPAIDKNKSALVTHKATMVKKEQTVHKSESVVFEKELFSIKKESISLGNEQKMAVKRTIALNKGCRKNDSSKVLTIMKKPVTQPKANEVIKEPIFKTESTVEEYRYQPYHRTRDPLGLFAIENEPELIEKSQMEPDSPPVETEVKPAKKKLNLQEYRLRKEGASNNSSRTVSPETFSIANQDIFIIEPPAITTKNTPPIELRLVQSAPTSTNTSTKNSPKDDAVIPSHQNHEETKKIFDPILEASRKILLQTKKQKALEALRRRDEELVLRKIPKVENLELKPLISDSEIMHMVNLAKQASKLEEVSKIVELAKISPEPPKTTPVLPELTHEPPKTSEYEEIIMVSVGTITESVTLSPGKEKPKTGIHFTIKKPEQSSVLKHNVFDTKKRVKTINRSPLQFEPKPQSGKKEIEMEKERFKDIKETIKSVEKNSEIKISSSSLFSSIQDVVMKKAPGKKHKEKPEEKKSENEERKRLRTEDDNEQKQIKKKLKTMIINQCPREEHGEDKVILHLPKDRIRPSVISIKVQTENSVDETAVEKLTTNSRSRTESNKSHDHVTSADSKNNWVKEMRTSKEHKRPIKRSHSRSRSKHRSRSHGRYRRHYIRRSRSRNPVKSRSPHRRRSLSHTRCLNSRSKLSIDKRYSKSPQITSQQAKTPMIIRAKTPEVESKTKTEFFCGSLAQRAKTVSESSEISVSSSSTSVSSTSSCSESTHSDRSYYTPSPMRVSQNLKGASMSPRNVRNASRSPRKGSESPRKSARSPRNISRSPRRGSSSPRRDLSRSQKISGSPRRILRSPNRKSRSPRRLPRSPRRFSRSPQRSRSPRIYSRSPRRDSRSPRRRSRSPSRSPASLGFRSQYRSETPDRVIHSVEERRIVYVGKLEEDITKSRLRSTFSRYGPITEVTIHTKDNGGRYGFVTFRRGRDAWTAVESARTAITKYDVGFGGRRAFCRQRYADLDGIEAEYRECDYLGMTTLHQTEDVSFEDLLNETKRKLSKMKKTDV